MDNKLLEQTSLVASYVLSFNRPADAVLSYFFRNNKRLGQKDRSKISEIIFNLLRNLEKISLLLPDYAHKPRLAILSSLVIGHGLSINALQEICNVEEVEFLHKLKAQKNIFSGRLNCMAELPMWLIELLRESYNDEEILSLGRALNTPAPLDIRVNTIKEKRSKVLQQLQQEGYVAEATPYSPWGIRFEEKISLNIHPLFNNGSVEVQDEGSQLLSLLTNANRGEIVVDLCAGAGGKTLAMGAMMQNTGRIYAFDISEKRLNNLKPRLKKSGLSNVNLQLISNENDVKIKRLYGKCDMVLVDAPCSGTGTLRRNPDIKYRQSHESIQRISMQQQSILNAAAPLVGKNGRIIYATCSLMKIENEDQINLFLQNHPEFMLADVKDFLPNIPITGKMLRFNPVTHQTDGFFAAVLQRKE